MTVNGRCTNSSRHTLNTTAVTAAGHRGRKHFVTGSKVLSRSWRQQTAQSVNGSSAQIEEGVWNVTTDSGASKTYPSEEEIEQFHELFSEYGEEGYWAALTQSDATSFFGPPEERARSLAGANADEPNASEVSTERLNGYAWAFGRVWVSCGMINEVHL